MKKMISAITEWVNTGTKLNISIRKIMVVAIMLCLMYHAGYFVGSFLAHVVLFSIDFFIK